MPTGFPTASDVQNLLVQQQVENAAWNADIMDFRDAEAVLASHIAQLEREFVPCVWDGAGHLPRGEAFKEFVCGGELPPSLRRMYYSATPLLAVRLFRQTIDAHTHGIPTGSPLYWRTYPMIERFRVQFLGENSPFIPQPEWLFDVRCRLVILSTEKGLHATE